MYLSTSPRVLWPETACNSFVAAPFSAKTPHDRLAQPMGLAPWRQACRLGRAPDQDREGPARNWCSVLVSNEVNAICRAGFNSSIKCWVNGNR